MEKEGRKAGGRGGEREEEGGRKVGWRKAGGEILHIHIHTHTHTHTHTHVHTLCLSLHT